MNNKTDLEKLDRRQRIIKETEDDLNAWLRRGATNRRSGEQSRHACLYHPHKVSPRSQRQPYETHSKEGTFVQVPSNERGHLGAGHLKSLTMRLFRLTKQPHRGDVMLDMSGVVSASQRFLSICRSYADEFQDQGRELVILGLDGVCFADSGASDIV